MPMDTTPVYQSRPTHGTFDPPADLCDEITRTTLDRSGRWERDEVRFQCPMPEHPDRNPSARWNPKRAVWRCDTYHASGGIKDLASRLDIRNGMSRANPSPKTSPRRRTVATYDYTKAGKVLFQVVRYEPKAFSQRRPDGNGGWIHNMKGVEIVLYRHDELRAADPAAWVHLCAGEKDADRLYSLGKVATTAPMGEGKWRPSYTDVLRGRKVAIYVDNDPTGRQHAQRLAPILSKDCAAVKVVELPDLPDKGDVSDWLAAGHTAEDLDAFLASVPKWEPEETATSDTLPAPTAQAIPPAPGWPSGVLPLVVEKYAAAHARAIGVPIEMVAVPILAFAGGAIGNLVRLKIKNGWHIYPALWAGVIADPGMKKTPALKAAQWSANIVQKALYEQWQRRMAEWEAEMQAWESKPKPERGPKPEPPRLEHLYSTDATMEKLVDMLASNYGLTITRDELSGLIGAMDKYRAKGDDRQQYLSLWAGTPIKVDRLGGGTIYAPNPVVSIYGGIQPDYVRELHSSSGRRDGMVERFLLFWPEVQRTGWTDDEAAPALLDPLVETFKTIRTIRSRLADAFDENDASLTVQPHSAAKDIWVEWYNGNDAGVEATSGLRRGFYSKLDSQVARLALILHCLHNPHDPRVLLQADTMRAAIEIAEFFRDHLDRVLPLIGDHSRGEPVGLPGRILRYLRMDELQEEGGWVRRSTLYSRLRNVSADTLTATLGHLQAEGTVESRVAGSATRPSEQWRIPTEHRSSHSWNSQDSAHFELGEADIENHTNMKNGHSPTFDPPDPYGSVQFDASEGV